MSSYTDRIKRNTSDVFHTIGFFPSEEVIHAAPDVVNGFYLELRPKVTAEEAPAPAKSAGKPRAGTPEAVDSVTAAPSKGAPGHVTINLGRTERRITSLHVEVNPELARIVGPVFFNPIIPEGPVAAATNVLLVMASFPKEAQELPWLARIRQTKRR